MKRTVFNSEDDASTCATGFSAEIVSLASVNAHYELFTYGGEKGILRIRAKRRQRRCLARTATVLHFLYQKAWHTYSTPRFWRHVIIRI